MKEGLENKVDTFSKDYLYHGNKEAVKWKIECSEEYVKSNGLEKENYLIFKKLNFNHVPVPISKNLRNEKGEENVYLYVWILHKILSWNLSLSKRKGNILLYVFMV